MYAVIYVNMKLRVNQWNIAHENEEDDIYLDLFFVGLWTD